MSSPPAAIINECPLHTAMEELARISVSQHVRYLQGECLPRHDLLPELQAWTSLHALICRRMCSALRSSPLSAAEFDATVASVLSPGGVEIAQATRLRQAIRDCYACNGSETCPLG